MDSVASHDSRLERSLYPSMQRPPTATVDTFGTTRFADGNGKGVRTPTNGVHPTVLVEGRQSSRWSSREDLLSPQPPYPVASSSAKDGLFVALYDFHGVGDEQLSLRKGPLRLSSCRGLDGPYFLQEIRCACSATTKRANGARRSWSNYVVRTATRGDGDRPVSLATSAGCPVLILHPPTVWRNILGSSRMDVFGDGAPTVFV
jgi:hypothetical protein